MIQDEDTVKLVPIDSYLEGETRKEDQILKSDSEIQQLPTLPKKVNDPIMTKKVPRPKRNKMTIFNQKKFRKLSKD
jgi:hypothetical protein